MKLENYKQIEIYKFGNKNFVTYERTFMHRIPTDYINKLDEVKDKVASFKFNEHENTLHMSFDISHYINIKQLF